MDKIHAILGTHHIYTVEYLKEILERLRSGDTRPGYTPEHYQSRLVTTAEDALKVIEYLVNGANAIREEITAAGKVGSEFTDMGGIKRGVKEIAKDRAKYEKWSMEELKGRKRAEKRLAKIYELACSIEGNYLSSIADDDRINQIAAIASKEYKGD